MTIQSLAWAIDQPLPGTAKLVLLAMANHADHLTGRVGFDAATIAGEASIREPSLWRYLGALERNGYVSKEICKAAGDKREYWLALDRDPSLPWAWSANEDGERSDDDAVDTSTARTTDSGLSARRQFDRSKQDAQRQVATAPEPGRPEGLVPVIEGSRAYWAWCDHLRAQRKPSPYVRGMIVQGKECRGFWMPTLFPPGVSQSVLVEGE